MTAHQNLLLLPGMLCDERLFAPQIEALSETCNIEVANIKTADTMEQLAQNILDTTAFDRFAVAGLSMGGIVAMALLRLAPERITKLALLNTNPLAEKPERQAQRQIEIDAIKAGQLQGMVTEVLKPIYLAKANRDNIAIKSTVYQMAVDTGKQGFINQSLALRDRPDSTETLRKFRGKTLILVGAEDTLCPPERHKFMASLMPQAVLKIIPDAGHLSTLEQPTIVSDAFKEWLDDHHNA